MRPVISWCTFFDIQLINLLTQTSSVGASGEWLNVVDPLNKEVGSTICKMERIV